MPDNYQVLRERIIKSSFKGIVDEKLGAAKSTRVREWTMGEGHISLNSQEARGAQKLYLLRLLYARKTVDPPHGVPGVYHTIHKSTPGSDAPTFLRMED